MYIVRLALQIIYVPIKRFPQRQKVTFISRQSNQPSLDYKLLIQKINESPENIEIAVLTKKLESNYIVYGFHMLQQMYHIATSKVVVLDGYCIVASILNHKNGTIIIQLWHALGCIKKFGYQAIDTQEGSSADTARIMKMHKNYDIVTCASSETARYYSQAFNVPPERIKIWGMPRVDYLKRLKESKEKIISEYPTMQGKELIVYIPTFRKTEPVFLEELTRSVNLEKYQLLIRLHPLDNTPVDDIFKCEQQISTYDLLELADYVITDYSAAGIEASILNKKIYFYLYDLKDYQEKRGLNMEMFQPLAGVVRQNAKEIIKLIEHEPYDFAALELFRQKYVQTLDFDNTEKIADEIINNILGGSANADY